MESPEYYEHIRLRDVFLRDVSAVTAIIDTLLAQKRLLGHVASREDTGKAFHQIGHAVDSLGRLRRELQAEADSHTVRSGEAI